MSGHSLCKMQGFRGFTFERPERAVLLLRLADGAQTVTYFCVRYWKDFGAGRARRKAQALTDSDPPPSNLANLALDENHRVHHRYKVKPGGGHARGAEERVLASKEPSAGPPGDESAT
jgi:hypothetical protein